MSLLVKIGCHIMLLPCLGNTIVVLFPRAAGSSYLFSHLLAMLHSKTLYPAQNLQGLAAGVLLLCILVHRLVRIVLLQVILLLELLALVLS